MTVSGFPGGEAAGLGDDLARLAAVLEDCAPCVVAVSGGVDSLTLAAFAQRVLGRRARMAHAVSPAVPPAATARVRQLAAAQGWQLDVIEAGEFADPRYLANPVNRCYFCKSHLYDALAAGVPGQILSGANLDDLDDWRPGLDAARERGVRHPYIEAGVGKAALRAIARHLGLADVAELPAAPCLSSRVESGLPIVAPALAFVDAAERLLRARLDAETVRCRLRRAGIVIELDGPSHARLDGEAIADELLGALAALAADHGVAGSVSFAPYRRGSAFLRDAT